MYFSEIIKLQLGNKFHTLFSILKLFRIIVAVIIKNVLKGTTHVPRDCF